MSFEDKLGASTGTYLHSDLIDSGMFTMVKPSEPIGYWILYPGLHSAGSTRFAMYKRPTDEQIKNTEELLGWGWVEAKK
jgi:hypothetical protein